MSWSSLRRLYTHLKKTGRNICVNETQEVQQYSGSGNSHETDTMVL